MVGELAAGLDQHRHPAELGSGELVVDDVRLEHLAVLGVVERRLVGGLHHAEGAGGGLEAAVLEPRHLQVEALSQAALAADQVIGGHPPVLERELVGVHAAISDRVDRATLHPPHPIADRAPA